MKTLIVYGSTYGYASDCVQRLKAMLKGEVAVADAEKGGVPEIGGFDAVIIGGSVYMGKIQKSVKQFCEQNAAALAAKKLGLFLCCGLPEEFEQSLKNSFPAALLESAAVKACFGGELRMDRMKFVHKAITNMMVKANEKSGKQGAAPLPENIEKLAEAMNG